MKRPLIMLVMLIGSVMTSTAQEIKMDSLAVEEAVTIALEHNPQIRASDANLHSAEAGLTQARASYFPSITALATASHTDGALVTPGLPVRNQTYNSYTAGFQAQQTLIDFGKMVSRVSANSQFVDAAGYDSHSAREDVIVNVEVAYFNLMQSKQVVKVNEEAVNNTQQHLKEAQAFYSVGRRAQLDVTTAEVNLANAEVALIRSKNQVLIAKLQLESEMGVRLPSSVGVRNDFDVPQFSMTLDSAKLIMQSQRPDLLSAKAKVEANNALVTAAWSQHLPTLSASGAYTWSNFDFPLFSRWNAGVTLTLPIFQGFLIQGQVDQARAAAEAAKANLDVVTDAVMLDVEQQYLNVNEASERIIATTKLVEQAEQSLNLAEKQYAAGVGSQIEVTDAQLALSNARITRIQALFDYNSSLVRLQRAMGTLGR